MANQEQLDILKQGVEVWNQWRQAHEDIRPDLSYADFSNANLSGANLSGALFTFVDFSNANLSDADFSGAEFNHGNFNRANLRGANLRGAEFRDGNLREVDFRKANLDSVSLISMNLCEANFHNAEVSWAVFGNVDLSVVQGLDAVEHYGPSIIGIDTIYRSQGNIPEVFLKGAGVDDTFISYIRSLVGKPIEYYSCFISYSSKDEAFAKRLHADLQSNNVRCWFAPEDFKIGDKFWHRIDESIRLYDKLLVVLSQHSVESEWVEREVVASLEKEQQQKKLVLFPITLDETFKRTFVPWAADIRRSRHIGDFTCWKNHDEYQKAFNRLLRDLKSEA